MAKLEKELKKAAKGKASGGGKKGKGKRSSSGQSGASLEKKIKKLFK